MSSCFYSWNNTRVYLGVNGMVYEALDEYRFAKGMPVFNLIRCEGNNFRILTIRCCE